jgi:hypothetical protein
LVSQLKNLSTSQVVGVLRNPVGNFASKFVFAGRDKWKQIKMASLNAGVRETVALLLINARYIRY